MDDRKIGILDSGVGGLTIWKELVKELPQESTIYIGDSKNTPYGARPEDEIFRLASRMMTFLLEQQVKLIVVACNTITVSGIEKLRMLFADVPLIGTVPVIKTAARVTKKGKIGILSTMQTAESEYQKHLIELFAHDVEVVNRGTNTIVPLIEKGIMEGEQLHAILQKEMVPFQEAEVDVIALGCTHFPLVKAPMQQIMGEGVALLDSGPAVARQVRRILENNQAFTSSETVSHMLYTTGSEDTMRMIAAKTGIVVDDIRFTTLD